MASAELIFRIEDEFGMSFEDDEALRLRTVGDVYQMVVAKAGSASSLLSSRAFYRTRQALTTGLGVPRRSVQPTTALVALFPEPSRREQWGRVGARIGLKFPKLEHSRGWKDVFLLVSMAISALPIAALWWAFYAIGWIRGVGVMLFVIPALVLWVLTISRLVPRMERSTPQLARVLPFDTVEELTIGVVALNDNAFDPLKAENRPPSNEAAWQRVVAIFSNQSGIDPEEVSAQAAIAQELD